MKKQLPTTTNLFFLQELFRSKLDFVELEIYETYLRITFIDTNESYRVNVENKFISVEKPRGFISKLFGSSKKQEDKNIEKINHLIDELKQEEEAKVKELNLGLEEAKKHLEKSELDQAYSNAIKANAAAVFLDKKSPMDYRDKLGLSHFVVAEILRRKKQFEKSEKHADDAIANFSWLIQNYIITENIDSIVPAYHMKAIYLASRDKEATIDHHKYQFTDRSSFFSGPQKDRSELIRISDALISGKTVELKIGMEDEAGDN